MKKSCETRLNITKEDRSLILRRGRQTIRRATARLPKVFKIPQPARNCQRRVNEGNVIAAFRVLFVSQGLDRILLRRLKRRIQRSRQGSAKSERRCAHHPFIAPEKALRRQLDENDAAR